MTATAEKEPAKLLEAAKPYEFPFTLGADPEYTIIAGNRPMHAKEILMTFLSDLKVSASGLGYDFEGGNIGWDNHKQTGELRPKPGRPEQVAKNIKNLFTETVKRMPSVDFNTLTIAGSTGGHIHLSVPDNLTDMLIRKTPKWKAIERAIASFGILIMMSENEMSRELRKRSGNYGNFLDFRHGEQFRYPNGNPGYTLELRGPTAEWITTEKLAVGTLAYVAIAWDSILKVVNDPKSKALDAVAEIIFKSDKQGEEVIGPLLANYGGIQKVYLNKIRPFVRAHPAYKDYKDELELILNPERALEAKKQAHYSIPEGWGLATDSKNISQKDFLASDKVESATSKLPESVIRNLSQFSWNDDLGVQAFATAVAKRCIALSWKPQNEYYFFGLKRGFDSIVIRNEIGEFVSGTEIMQNRGDYDTVARKFERLAPRARPAYGRFIHPRSGELVSDSEMKRVMVGIPYEMRQKMDVNPLLKLILKYEKTPKAFRPIDPASLPEGESSLAKTLAKEEAIEQGVQSALEKGEAVREVEIDIPRQERETDDLISGRNPTTNAAPMSNLRNWLGRQGYFAIMSGMDRFEPATRAAIMASGMEIDPGALYAYYPDQPNTLIKLADDFATGLNVMADIIEVNRGAITNYFRGGSRPQDYRIAFSNSGGGYDFEINAAQMERSIAAYLSRINA